MIPRPPRTTLCPYTTLFRSQGRGGGDRHRGRPRRYGRAGPLGPRDHATHGDVELVGARTDGAARPHGPAGDGTARRPRGVRGRRAGNQFSTKALRARPRRGWRSLRRALVSIWRIRSLVTETRRP